jgi:hypothetical protein
LTKDEIYLFVVKLKAVLKFLILLLQPFAGRPGLPGSKWRILSNAFQLRLLSMFDR